MIFRRRFGATLVAIAVGLGVAGGVGGGVVLFNPQPAAAAVTANLFAVAPGAGVGTANCAGDATARTYAYALANEPNMICAYGTRADLGYSATSWDNACKAASLINTTGLTVGVEPGNYTRESSDGDFMKSTDCSGGKGAAVNPNCGEQVPTCAGTGTTAAWIKYVPASSTACPNVHWVEDSPTAQSAGFFFFNQQFHIVIQGSCFDLDSTLLYYSLSGVAGEIQVVGDSPTNPMHLYGIELKGPKDVLFKNINYGPNIQCGKNDPNVPAALRCDPNGPQFEAKLASMGTATSSCSANNTAACGGFFVNEQFVEPFFHQGQFSFDGSTLYENVRIQNFMVHDAQSTGVGSGFHPGCFMFDGVNGDSSRAATLGNIIFDHVSCERQTGEGWQLQDGGVIVENSYFSCPTYSVGDASANPTGKWDLCNPAKAALGLGCKTSTQNGCTQTNVLIRYDTFDCGNSACVRVPTWSDGGFGNYSSVRFVADIFMNSLTGNAGAPCSITGVTFSTNAYAPGVSQCGSGNTTLSSGDPFTQSSIATPGDSWSASALLNLHLASNSAGASVPTVNPAVLGSDYQVDHDADGNPRGSTSTHVGAYN